MGIPAIDKTGKQVELVTKEELDTVTSGGSGGTSDEWSDEDIMFVLGFYDTTDCLVAVINRTEKIICSEMDCEDAQYTTHMRPIVGTFGKHSSIQLIFKHMAGSAVKKFTLKLPDGSSIESTDGTFVIPDIDDYFDYASTIGYGHGYVNNIRVIAFSTEFRYS